MAKKKAAKKKVASKVKPKKKVAPAHEINIEGVKDGLGRPLNLEEIQKYDMLIKKRMLPIFRDCHIFKIRKD